MNDPIAQEFLDWRQDCESTIRNSYQILSRGEPNLENELWRVSAQVINGDITPDEAAQQIQIGPRSMVHAGVSERSGDSCRCRLKQLAILELTGAR